MMTVKRFRVTISNTNAVSFVDVVGKKQLMSITFKDKSDAIDCKNALMYQCDLMNELHEEKEQLQSRINDYDVALKTLQDLCERKLKEDEQLKKALLFFYDVANCECSTNWKGDMEKGCKRFFNCTYEEAKEKYGDYDGMWWEIND